MKTILKMTLLMMIMATVAPVLNSCTKNDGNEEPCISGMPGLWRISQSIFYGNFFY